MEEGSSLEKLGWVSEVPFLAQGHPNGRDTQRLPEVPFLPGPWANPHMPLPMSWEPAPQSPGASAREGRRTVCVL